MNTKFFALAAFALSLAACTNDNEVMDNSPVAARINAEIRHGYLLQQHMLRTERQQLYRYRGKHILPDS